jgi:Domain of unknown function (DUF397)
VIKQIHARSEISTRMNGYALFYRPALCIQKAKSMSKISPGHSGISWRKASRSVGNGECVEISSHQGVVSIRDSKNPQGPVLTYPAKAFRAFLHTAKGGDSER